MGGLWLVLLLMAPVLAGLGFAPLPVVEITAGMTQVLVVAALCGLLLQALMLVHCEGRVSLWQDMRGQLLQVTALAAAGYLTAPLLWPQASWQQFCLWSMALCGLVLVLQPLPAMARDQS